MSADLVLYLRSIDVSLARIADALEQLVDALDEERAMDGESTGAPVAR